MQKIHIINLIQVALINPVTDTIPKVAEDLLYGLKHSENPLKFSIEIVNTDGAIPIEQMKKLRIGYLGKIII